MRSLVARLEPASFDPAAELRALTRRAKGAGAVVSFVGIARDTDLNGNRVDMLILEHHPTMTLKSLEEITSNALARFDITQVHIVHRFGEILPGEPIVFAGVASPHRRAAFDAADYLMDRLKTEAVFWKRERVGGGSCWIEPTEGDYAARGRWE
jgi:molybdopterin synthase catalytic subunit